MASSTSQLYALTVALLIGLNLSVAAASNIECGSFYAVNELAAQILIEAGGAKSEASRLITSPRFSKIIVAQKRRDPDFVKKLKQLLETKPAQSVVEAPPVRKTESRNIQPNYAVSNMPLNLGTFEYAVVPGGLGFGKLELPNGEILSLADYRRGGGPEIIKYKPVIGSDGKVSYEDMHTRHGYIDNRNNAPVLVSPDTAVVLSYYEESKQRMSFIDLNNIQAKSFQHVSLEHYRSHIDLLPLPDQRILIIHEQSGSFSVYDRTQGRFSETYPYSPKNPKPNTAFPRASKSAVLPNGDLLISNEIDQKWSQTDGDKKSFVTIQHWIRQPDGTFKPGKDFDVAEYPHDALNPLVRFGPKVRLVGMKVLKNGIVITAEEPGILKTWKWDQLSGELVLQATEKIFPENIEANIQTLELLADGQVLVNTERKDNPSFPLISVDQNGKMTVTANLPALEGRGEVMPLSHGGFYARPIMKDAWLWTRKP